MVDVRHIAVALLALGCSAGRQPVPDDTARASGSQATAPSVAMASWHSTPWQAHAGVDPSDLGHGVVFLAVAEDKGARGVADSLLLRALPDSNAAPVGAMILAVTPDGAATYRVAAADSLRPNLVEHGYEESGVPFDSTDASGQWVRGILGFRADGSALTGWINLETQGVGTTHWAAALANRPIFFPKPELAAFFSGPDSARPAPSPPREPDYAVYPEEARGPWLRVRLVQPSDLCTPPDSVRRETRTLWVRYLDDRGRPTVWYHTRGC